MKIIAFLIFFLASTNIFSVEEIKCSTQTCSGGSSEIIEKNYYTTIKKDFSETPEKDMKIIKQDKYSQPKNIKVYSVGSSKNKYINQEIILNSEVSSFNGGTVFFIGDVLDKLFINLDGYNGDESKSSSQICADKINAGEYGTLIKADFDSRRIIDPSIPKNKCSYADLAFIQNQMFKCDEGYSEILASNPTVDVKRYKGKFKCVGVSFEDICVAPAMEISCKWKLKYAGLYPAEQVRNIFTDSVISSIVSKTYSNTTPTAQLTNASGVTTTENLNKTIVKASNGNVYKFNDSLKKYELSTTLVRDVFGSNRELINYDGLKYWVKSSGELVTSPVGQYSSNPTESEEKKFVMFEDEYYAKKSFGMIPYMCENLTKGITDDFRKESDPIIDNPYFSKNNGGWNSLGKSYWNNRKLKIDTNAVPLFLRILSGESYTIPCGDYNFKELIIDSGGELVLTGGSCLTKISVLEDFVLNGKIRTLPADNRGYSISTPVSDGRIFEFITAQASGGSGVYGSSQYEGHGGGGGGGPSPEHGGGSRGTGYRGGSGGNGGTFVNKNGYSGASADYYGAGGGGGGYRGSHGSPVYIIAKNLQGTGIIDTRGWNGGNGGSGGGSGGFNHRHCKKNKVYTRCGWAWHGAGGAYMGGGGAGGSGGDVYIEYSNTLSNTISYITSGGAGGYPYAANGYNGRVVSFKINEKIYDKIIPSFVRQIQTEQNKTYRIKIETSQPIENKELYSGMISVYNGATLDETALIKRVSAIPDGTYPSALIDTFPKTGYFQTVANSSIISFLVQNRDDRRFLTGCEQAIVSSDENPSLNSPHSSCFSLVSDNCPSRLNPKESCFVKIKQTANCPIKKLFVKKMCSTDKISTRMEGKKESPFIINLVNKNLDTYIYEEKIQQYFQPMIGNYILYDMKNVPPAYKSCADVQKNNKFATSGIYKIDPDGTGGNDPFDTYCNLNVLNGGWTLAMKLSSKDNIFGYSSEYWTTSKLFNEKDAMIESDLSMKNNAFNLLKGKEFLFCMGEVSNNCIVVSIDNPVSLKDIFSGYSSITTTKQEILKMFGETPPIQPYCNLVKSNVIATQNGSNSKSMCRFGLLTNNENDCATPESFIGFGCGYYNNNLLVDSISSGSYNKIVSFVKKKNGYIFVRDSILNSNQTIFVESRRTFDFTFTAKSSETTIELSAIHKEVPVYYDNVSITAIDSEHGATFPAPSGSGEKLANFIGADFPGYFELEPNPSLAYSEPSFNSSTYKTEVGSLWDIRYVKIGERCPLYYKKISNNIVMSHTTHSEDPSCSDVEYKYDPENSLIDWRNSGLDRKKEFGLETIKCAPSGCVVRSNIDHVSKSFDTINLKRSAQGTSGGNGSVYVYDFKNIVLSTKAGISGDSGVNDLPAIVEKRMCVKIQDAVTSGDNSEFAMSPLVDFKDYSWQAVSVESPQLEVQTPNKTGKINIFKKMDSSSLYLLFKELY